MKLLRCFFFIFLFMGEMMALDIQQLIDEAKPFDVVEVPYGKYDASNTIIVDKPLVLKGVGMPILDGMHNQSVIHIVAPQVMVEGLNIINAGYSEVTEYAGIKVDNVDKCDILNNRFNNNVYSVFISKSKNCNIKENEIYANSRYEATSGNGIHLWSCSNIKIEKNRISGHRDGIYIEFTVDSIIKENISRDNIRYGLHFMYSHRNKYTHNTFHNNQTGVAVMYSKHIEMMYNKFQKSWGRTAYGLLLKDISDSYIGFNIFKGNTMGIVFDAANRNIFIGNYVLINGWALNILGNSESNLLKNNFFLINFFDAMTNADKTTNVFWGNYWSSYHGYDLDYDGIGDIPFRPMKIFARWVAKYPELTVLLGSPIVEFLELAEKVFPVFTPMTFIDTIPMM